MRRGLPRKTDLATLSNQRLLSLVRSYNHTPRKCLNYKTPAEVFCRDLLHFKCESTFIGEGARRAEKLKSLRLDSVPFVYRTDYVSRNCTDHGLFLSIYPKLHSQSTGCRALELIRLFLLWG